MKDKKTLKYTKANIVIEYIDRTDIGTYSCEVTNGVVKKTSTENSIDVLCKGLSFLIFISCLIMLTFDISS